MKTIKSILIAATFWAFLPGSVSADEAKTLKVGYLPTAEHVLYFIAKEKGFFQQDGINNRADDRSGNGRDAA